MEKKDKKSGKRGRGLDTIGKRILVLTIAILMTFQFCTPSFYGISFADEEEILAETAEPVEQAVEPAETPDEEVQAEERNDGRRFRLEGNGEEGQLRRLHWPFLRLLGAGHGQKEDHRL